jgi:hypothetical protein
LVSVIGRPYHSYAFALFVYVMKLTAAEVLDQIAVPGRTLALCDETDLTQAPTETMVADIHAWVAFLMRSDGYSRIAASMLAYQAQHGLPELHGNEIVNPGSKSAWLGVAPETRIAAYRFACELVAAHALEVRYVHISKGQYAEMIDAHSGAPLPKGHKQAVKAVFKASITEHLVSRAPAILIFDKDNNKPGPTLELIAGAAHLVGGGIVRAESHNVPGLQLADVAGCAVGRYIRRRDNIIVNAPDLFDRIAMTMVAELRGRFISAL